MIYMTTGLPGAGKTLFTIQTVLERSKKESRPVYYDGITILDNELLPWLPLDGIPWYKAPHGSIIVIDECQRLYRPRGLGSKVPDEVEKMETHRHLGIDIYLITQHPMLVDSNVRRLVNTHYHVMRKFGAGRAVVHEFPTGVRDNPDKSRVDSIRHDWVYPKKLFSAYKSAEIHTHKFKLPMRVWLMFSIPVILLPLLYFSGKWFYDAASGKKNALYSGQVEQSPQSTALSLPSSKNVVKDKSNSETSIIENPVEFNSSRTPIVLDIPESAPVYQRIAKPTIAPRVAACIKSLKTCICYSQQGTRLRLPLDSCERLVLQSNFIDYQPVEFVDKITPRIDYTEKRVQVTGSIPSDFNHELPQATNEVQVIPSPQVQYIRGVQAH